MGCDSSWVQAQLDSYIQRIRIFTLKCHIRVSKTVFPPNAHQFERWGFLFSQVCRAFFPFRLMQEAQKHMQARTFGKAPLALIPLVCRPNWLPQLCSSSNPAWYPEVEDFAGEMPSLSPGPVPRWSTIVLGTQPQRKPFIQSPRSRDSLESWEDSRAQKASHIFPYIQSQVKLLPSFTQFLEVLLHLANLISLLHESTFNKSSQHVLFFLCLAIFTSGPATQKPLSTS